VRLGFEYRVFTLVKQAFYHFSHTSSPQFFYLMSSHGNFYIANFMKCSVWNDVCFFFESLFIISYLRFTFLISMITSSIFMHFLLAFFDISPWSLWQWTKVVHILLAIGLRVFEWSFKWRLITYRKCSVCEVCKGKNNASNENERELSKFLAMQVR
jgi:hypothetical protein